MMNLKAAAMKAFQGGNLKEASALCNQIISKHPADGEILHLLAFIHQQEGRYREAESVVRQALKFNPGSVDIACCLADLLRDQSRFDEATAVYLRTIEKNPGNVELSFRVGNHYKKLADFKNAGKFYKKVLELSPDHGAAHNNLANALREIRDFGGAVNHARRALELMPQHPGVLLTLGNALFDAGKLNEAIIRYRLAESMAPDSPEVSLSLSNVLNAQGKFVEAAKYGIKAIKLNPDSVEAYVNTGNAMKSLGRYQDAIKFFSSAVELDAGTISAYTNLGQVYLEAGDIKSAIDYCRKAIMLDPDNAMAFNNLGNALMIIGRLPEAIDNYEEALRISPDLNVANSNYLLCINYCQQYDARSIYRKHQEFARQYESTRRQHTTQCDLETSVYRRLKIGYVSADFRSHSGAFFIAPVLANHDKQQFEIFCYYNHNKVDEYTERFRTYADHWRTISGSSDSAAADIIRRDNIDILVDLSGHTSGNRLIIFTQRAAPVQATWLGYLNTTGLSAMDYRITDDRATPRGELDKYHSERLIRMPDCQWCYEPPDSAPVVGPLPAGSSGIVTFASFHTLAKIADRNLDMWARLLVKIPESRLLIVAFGVELFIEHARGFFERQGIDLARVEFIGKQKFQDYLEMHNQVDINLDVTPYTGGTTTCHSLWMGVPVITLTGDTVTSRGGASLLGVLGMSQLIANSDEQYIDIAVYLSRNLDLLADYRQELRSRMRKSCLTDGRLFTRSLEMEYQRFWQEYCKR